MRLFAAIILFSAVVEPSLSLQCYYCHSLENLNCLNGPLPDEMLTECKPGLTKCGASTVGEPGVDQVVSRSCATGDHWDGCSRTPYLGPKTMHCICQGNGCNMQSFGPPQ